jgi:hypothetical protein
MRGGGERGRRSKASRARLNEDLARVLYADFAVHGPAVIALVREEEPGTYLQIAKLVPREVRVERPLGALSDAELAIPIEAARDALHAGLGEQGGEEGQTSAGEAPPLH